MEQFLPIIIIAILSFLFNRNKKPEKPPVRRNEPSRPQHQTAEQEEYEIEEDKREFKPFPTPAQGFPNQPMSKGFQSLKEAAEAMLAKSRPDLEMQERAAAEKMRELKREEERLLARAEKLKQTAASTAPALDAGNSPDQGGLPEFSQREVLNGIIMAEVLGKPRAKNPYHMPRR